MVNNFAPVLRCHLMSHVRCKAKPVENHCYKGSKYITKTHIFPCLCRTSFNQYLLSLWESIWTLEIYQLFFFFKKWAKAVQDRSTATVNVWLKYLHLKKETFFSSNLWGTTASQTLSPLYMTCTFVYMWTFMSSNKILYTLSIQGG